MQEYLQRSRLGEVMDALGFRTLALLVCLGWFIFLWGVRLPALCAGLSLFMLVMLLEKKTRDARLLRREKKLRVQIGGELFLEKLLMDPPVRAHFEAAAVFSSVYPLTLIRSGERGVLCTLRKEPVFFSFLQLPPSAQAADVHILVYQRAAREAKAERLVLCVPCAIGKSAYLQAENGLPVTFLDRAALIAHLGAACPATDEQLVALGKRKRAHVPAARWVGLIFAPERMRRYLLYGLLLLFLYFVTHLLYYGVPAMLCFFLAAICRCFSKKRTIL